MIPTDDIIEMAKQCGLPLTYVLHDDDTFSPHVDGLVAFARLVSAYEREAALAEPQECKWVYDDDGFFKSACEEVSFMPDLSVGHPDEYMKHCYGCGKPIRFVEPGQEEDDD